IYTARQANNSTTAIKRERTTRLDHLAHRVNMVMATKTLHFPSGKHMLTIRTPHENIVRSASARPANTATRSVLRDRSQRRCFFKPRQELTNRLPSLQDTTVINGVNHKVNRLSECGTQAVPHTLNAV